LHATLDVDEVAPASARIRVALVIESLLARLDPDARHPGHHLVADRGDSVHQGPRRLVDEVPHVAPHGAARGHYGLRAAAAADADVHRAPTRADVPDLHGFRERVDHGLRGRLRG